MHTLSKQAFVLGILGFLICGIDFEIVAEAPTPPLIPRPLRLEAKQGTFLLTPRTTIASSAAARKEAEKLANVLRGPTGFPLRITESQTANDSVNLQWEPALESTLGKEGYALSISPDRVSIRAASEAGLQNGGVTFRQLLPPEIFRSGTSPVERDLVSWSAPCLEIEDSPRFPWRGLLIDVARHYMPVDFLKKAVDLVAIHKMNSLQLHLTDDQGWRVEIKKYPRLTQIGSVRKESPAKREPNRGDGVQYGPCFYTQAEIRDLVSYAQARHVTLLPEIEMPGHFLGALAAYPQFSCRGGPFEVRTRWGVEEDILCAGNDEAFEFVRDILTEIVEMFPSRFIHIGGDEAPRDRWKECPKCQARMRRESLKNEAELQTYFNRRIEAFLTSKGRRLIGWDEILEGGLTPGAAVMSWRGVEGGIAAANAGHDVVMSPTSHCYFDYAQSREPGELESIGGFIPLPTVYDFEPIPVALDESKRHHILGAQGNVWTEFIHTPAEAEHFAFPRAAALAEVLWSPAEGKDYLDFHRRLKEHQKRLDALRVNYRKLDLASPVAE